MSLPSRLRGSVALAIFCVALCGELMAQRPDFSPIIQPDGRVTFRLKWPGADKVELVARGDVRHNDFDQPVYAMERGADDVWQVTVGPLLPGIQLYRFRVNGVEVVDPFNNSVQRFFRGPWSRIEVPDAEPKPWTPQADVPHGRVEIRRFGRAMVGWEHPVYVYLPPGYREGAGEALPVLYLLHGSDYSEGDWVEDGRVDVILDNLIAAGRARRMIVVMPLGYSRLPIDAATAQPDEYERWSAQILNGLMPWVEKNYGTVADRRGRAVAGLSMGGHQALRLALQNPTRFAWVGAFSSGATGLRLYPDAYAPALAENAPKPELVFMACGQRDASVADMKQTCELFTRDGLRTEWLEVDARHTWRVWRQGLSDFVTRLFPASPHP